MTIEGHARHWLLLLGAIAACSEPTTDDPSPSGPGGVGSLGSGGMVASGGMGGQGGMSGQGGMPGLAGTAGSMANALSDCERSPDHPGWLRCWGNGQGECGDSACRFEDVCYPDQTSTHDGCCFCNDAAMLCLDSPSCPSSKLIGKRCDSDDDCSFPGMRSGLECLEALEVIGVRQDAPGRVCTRPCGLGCPAGTGCLGAGAVDAGVEGGLCLRRCIMSECEGTAAVPLGSECAATGFGPQELVSFCF